MFLPHHPGQHSRVVVAVRGAQCRDFKSCFLSVSEMGSHGNFSYVSGAVLVVAAGFENC